MVRGGEVVRGGVVGVCGCGFGGGEVVWGGGGGGEGGEGGVWGRFGGGGGGGPTPPPSHQAPHEKELSLFHAALGPH